MFGRFILLIVVNPHFPDATPKRKVEVEKTENTVIITEKLKVLRKKQPQKYAS